VTNQESADALKEAAKKIGSAATLEYLMAIAPWVRLPVIYQVFKWLIEFILSTAINKTELGAFFLFIDVRTSMQGREFIEAAQKNRQAQMNGTQKEKLTAERNLIDSFRAFVRFTS
jgi:hypothetical protein